MSLRAKTTLSIIVAMAVLLALLGVLHARSSLERFRVIEDQQALADSREVQRQLDAQLADLSGTNADWAYWDESYGFVTGANPGFREANLYPEAFSQVSVDTVIYADRRGAPIYAARYTPSGETPVPGKMLELVQPGSPLAAVLGNPRERRTGLVLIGPEVMLASTRAVLRSSDKAGTPGGMLLMARDVDDALIDQIAALTGLSVTASPCGDGSCAGLPDTPVITKGDTTITTQTIIPAIDGTPALSVRVEGSRETYLASAEGVRTVLLIVLLVGIGFTIAAIFGMRRLVIGRLERLEGGVSDIRGGGDQSMRLAVEGRDEIASLADGINEMLEALEQTRNELIVARDNADHASEAKSRFLARMSHEIRTPLNIALANAQLLQFDHPDGEAGESIQQIIDAARHVTRLMDEFLDVARIEAGAIPLDLSPLDATEVTAEVVNMSQRFAAEAGASITLHGEPAAMVVADATRLRQVLLNLLSNAVKYGGTETPVEVHITSHEDTTSISVTDHGPGIPADMLDRLFVPFDRLDADKGTKSGTGIGLVVTKQLLELMNGTLRVASVPGSGTTFTASLPREPLLDRTSQARDVLAVGS